MQKIFYNANVYTFNDAGGLSQAFLVNDGIITFAGENNEILCMKTDETELVDMKGRSVYSAFFDLDKSIYELVKERVRLKKSDETSSKNVEKFKISELLSEFYIIQEEFIKNGITTISETKITEESFEFFKKLSESKKLKIDVVGYVDLSTSKQVMDDNCRTYRKYVGHFRLSGYSLSLDGKIESGKAWRTVGLRKRVYGYGNYFDEGLSFILKSALDDKKQLLVEANGNLAVDQFIRCFSEVLEKGKYDDIYKPIIKCVVLSKNQLKKLKNLGVAVMFDMSYLTDCTRAELKSLALINKNFLPVKLAAELGIDFLLTSNEYVSNISHLIQSASSRKCKDNKLVVKENGISTHDALKSLTLLSAEYVFDGSHKGSLESGKQANFIVTDSADLSEVLETYVLGEKL